MATTPPVVEQVSLTNPKDILVEFEGAERLELDSPGTLLFPKSVRFQNSTGFPDEFQRNVPNRAGTNPPSAKSLMGCLTPDPTTKKGAPRASFSLL
jgi:hypothetical protein